MKTRLPLLPLFAFLLLFTSCKDDMSEVEIKDPQAYLMSLNDSCSYLLDGKLYIHDRRSGDGRGNAQVNLDSITDKGYPDSVLFYTMFKLSNKDYESFTIRFVKKYGENQLPYSFLSVYRPENELELYTKGEHPYAVDYTRVNTRNGIAIDVQNNTDKQMQSYLPDARRWLTTIGYDCQSNSNFEILNLHLLPNGKHLLEARFSANVFYYEEQLTPDNVVMVAKQKRIENGYLRLQID